MHEFMELSFLGTGGSWPTAARNTAAIALKRGSEVILFDCGEGTQRQFQRAPISYMAVSQVFITHLHADHYLGLPGLLQTMGLNERKEALHIYGPAGTKAMCKALLGRPMPRPSFPLHVHELTDGDEVRFDGYQVRTRRLDHSIECLGYALIEDPRPGRFNRERAIELGVPEGRAFGMLQRGEPVSTTQGIVEPHDVLGPARRGRKVVYTGDCTPCVATIELAQGADILIHDSTYEADQPEANEYGHSTCVQAAFIAMKAQVYRLYLTHISPRYTDTDTMVKQAAEVFPAVTAAHDLLTLTVPFPADEAVDSADVE